MIVLGSNAAKMAGVKAKFRTVLAIHTHTQQYQKDCNSFQCFQEHCMEDLERRIPVSVRNAADVGIAAS
jgi:hypothetical protein